PAREARRAHAIVREGAGAVVAVDAESLRNEHDFEDQEEDHPRREQPGHSNKMLLVLQEPVHDPGTMSRGRPPANDSDALFREAPVPIREPTWTSGRRGSCRP